MIEYGFIVSFSIFLYFFFLGVHWKKDTVNKISLSFFFISYFILLALRDISVGIDTVSYVNAYNNISRMNWSEAIPFGNEMLGFEKGFTIFLKVMSCMNSNRVFLIAAAAIIVLPVMYFYIHEARDALFCISFFLISLLFEMFLSGMRQSIAIAFSIPAFYFVRDRKKILFILTVLLASTFHTSAILLFLLYPIYHARITKKWLFFIVPLFIAIYYFKDILATYIFLLAGNKYTEGYLYLNDQSGQFSLMILFVLLSFYSYIVLDEKKADEEDIGLRNILLLAALIHLFTPINPAFSRMNYYFILFTPAAISRVNSKSIAILKNVSILANYSMSFFFIIYFFLFKGDSLNVMHYQFFF